MTAYNRTSGDLIKTYTDALWAVQPESVARFEQRYDELAADDTTADNALETAYQEVSSQGIHGALLDAHPEWFDFEGNWIG